MHTIPPPPPSPPRAAPAYPISHLAHLLREIEATEKVHVDSELYVHDVISVLFALFVMRVREGLIYTGPHGYDIVCVMKAIPTIPPARQHSHLGLGARRFVVELAKVRRCGPTRRGTSKRGIEILNRTREARSGKISGRSWNWTAFILLSLVCMCYFAVRAASGH